MGQKFEPINKENVVDQVIKSITDSIVSGKYKAGMKLPNEYELIEELKVSRNSLREAMKILSAMGIVEIKRGDGTYICTQMNPSMFDTVIYSIIYDLSTNAELLELRQIIDEAIVRLAMQKITEEELEGLRSNIEALDEAIGRKDYEEAKELDFDFHVMLIDACKNRFFIRIMKGVYSIFDHSIIKTVEYEREMSRVGEYHKEILKCVVGKDMEHVSDVIAESLSTWQDVVK